MDYRASALWSMNLILLRDTQANPGNGGGFDEVTVVRLGYLRNIRRLKFNLGIGYESRTTEGFTVADIANTSFDYLTYDVSLTMPLYKDNLDATVSMRYRDFSASQAADSWDGIQTGIGLSWKF